MPLREWEKKKNYKKLRDEIIIDKVNEIFRTQPDNYVTSWNTIPKTPTL